MLVVVVGSAPLRDPPEATDTSPPTPPTPLLAPTGGLRTVHLPVRPELAEDVVSALHGSDETSCLVVGDQCQAEVVRRVAGFARQALHGLRITGWTAPTSPFRLAVALSRLESLERDAPLPPGGHEIALREIVRHSHGVVAASSAARLRPVRPTLVQRATFARGGGLYLVPDRPAVRSVWVLRPQTSVLPADLQLPPLVAGYAATVAAGPDGPDVTHLLELLGTDAEAVDRLDGRPAWSAHWGAGATAEIVLEPAASWLVTQAARAAVSRSWSCSWCDAKVAGGEPCAVCGAGTPSKEPVRTRPRRAAVLPLR